MNKTAIFLMIAFTAFAIACNNKNNNPDTNPLASDPSKTRLVADSTKTILFFGNSLTAGYGLDPTEAFPTLIQHKIDSAKLPYKVINGGVSGETSADGNQRIDFVLKQQKINVFVLELGANDGLRGLPLTDTRKNLQAIIDKVKAKYPNTKLVLAGMQIPPNLGQSYASQFKDIFPELAKKNSMTLIPFLLAGVAGEANLNQQDGIHPTAEGDKIVAENVWKELKGIL